MISRTHLTIFIAALLLVVPIFAFSQSPRVVRVLKQEGRSINQDTYYLELLELALELTEEEYGPYTMKLTDKVYSQREGLKEMKADGPIDVVYTMTSEVREYVLKPIRIPILKGMMGYRIPLVKSDRKNIFASVSSITDLSNFVFCQGKDWPDTEILKANDLEVTTSSSYSDLFNMIERGEADAFPRGITEIWNELETYSDKDITADPNIIIQYPTAFYYFVRKTDKKLADRLEAGLNMAINNGMFNELFMKYNSEFIEKADFNNRTIIRLENPLLDEKTPLQRKELWLNVGSR